MRRVEGIEPQPHERQDAALHSPRARLSFAARRTEGPAVSTPGGTARAPQGSSCWHAQASAPREFLPPARDGGRRCANRDGDAGSARRGNETRPQAARRADFGASSSGAALSPAGGLRAARRAELQRRSAGRLARRPVEPARLVEAGVLLNRPVDVLDEPRAALDPHRTNPVRSLSRRFPLLEVGVWLMVCFRRLDRGRPSAQSQWFSTSRRVMPLVRYTLSRSVISAGVTPSDSRRKRTKYSTIGRSELTKMTELRCLEPSAQ